MRCGISTRNHQDHQEYTKAACYLFLRFSKEHYLLSPGFIPVEAVNETVCVRSVVSTMNQTGRDITMILSLKCDFIPDIPERKSLPFSLDYIPLERPRSQQEALIRMKNLNFPEKQREAFFFCKLQLILRIEMDP